MRFFRYTYVDAKTGVPTTKAPARNGPAAPKVAGLSFIFAEESRYPTSAPNFYGQCPDESDLGVSGVLEEMDAETLEARKAEELERRKTLLRKQIDAMRDSILFRDSIPYTFPGDPDPDGVQLRDERDRQNIQDNSSKALKLLIAQDSTTLIPFMPVSNNAKMMTAAQMAEMCDYLKVRGDNIYTAAWIKKGQVNAAETFDALKALDLQADWPE